jgi:hypothetical protein
MYDLRGMTRVCGLSVGSLTNQRGHFLLVDGSIDRIENVRGSVIVINGDIGSIDDVSGNVRVINGRILGSVSRVRGFIRSD